MEGTANSERAKAEAVVELVVHVHRDGRRQYQPVAKQAIGEQCRRLGVSIAAVALRMDESNAVRRWLMRRGFNSLATVVQTTLEENPF